MRSWSIHLTRYHKSLISEVRINASQFISVSVSANGTIASASSVRSTSAATTVTIADGAETFDERGPKNCFIEWEFLTFCRPRHLQKATWIQQGQGR